MSTKEKRPKKVYWGIVDDLGEVEVCISRKEAIDSDLVGFSSTGRPICSHCPPHPQGREDRAEEAVSDAANQEAIEAITTKLSLARAERDSALAKLEETERERDEARAALEGAEDALEEAAGVVAVALERSRDFGKRWRIENILRDIRAMKGVRDA